METGAACKDGSSVVRSSSTACNIDLNNVQFVRRYNELVFAYVIGC